MLYGGVEIAGRPDLANVAILDRLPIPFIRRARRYGFAIDPPYFRDLTSQFEREMAELEKDIASYIPPDRLHEFSDRSASIEAEGGDSSINAASAEQIGKLLFDMLGVGSGRQLKRTKTGRVSTGKAQLRDLQLESPVVRLVLAYRERAKLKNTYTIGLVEAAKFHPRGGCCPVCELPHRADTWRVHTEITTTRTETGRLSSKNPNLQNIPQRTELGAAVRAGFIASPGTRLCSTDFSQIELRMMAHLANCQSMIDVYEADGDLHMATAMECFGLTDESQVDSISHRIPAKTANFLTVYSGSGKALYAQLVMAMHILMSEVNKKTGKMKLDKMPEWLTIPWCEDFNRQWFVKRPEVLEYMDLQAYRMRRYGMVWCIFGRVRPTPEVKSTHVWIREAGLRQGGNTADQGSSAGLMKLAMGSVNEYLTDLYDGGRGPWCWGLLPVHDQLLTEADEEVADDVCEMQEHLFETVMDDVETGERLFRVPIKSESKHHARWEH